MSVTYHLVQVLISTSADNDYIQVNCIQSLANEQWQVGDALLRCCYKSSKPTNSLQLMLASHMIRVGSLWWVTPTFKILYKVCTSEHLIIWSFIKINYLHTLVAFISNNMGQGYLPLPFFTLHNILSYFLYFHEAFVLHTGLRGIYGCQFFMNVVCPSVPYVVSFTSLSPLFNWGLIDTLSNNFLGFLVRICWCMRG